MSLQDPIRRCESGLWHRFPLGLLYKRMVRRGDWYVKLDGTAAQLAREAVRHVPPSYRWLGRSAAAAEVDDQAGGRPEWHAAKASQRPGDRIWPFLINPWTSAMRAGYVVVRRGVPQSVIVTAVS